MGERGPGRSPGSVAGLRGREGRYAPGRSSHSHSRERFLGGRGENLGIPGVQEGRVRVQRIRGCGQGVGGGLWVGLERAEAADADGPADGLQRRLSPARPRPGTNRLSSRWHWRGRFFRLESCPRKERAEAACHCRGSYLHPRDRPEGHHPSSAPSPRPGNARLLFPLKTQHQGGRAAGKSTIVFEQRMTLLFKNLLLRSSMT
ncbi:uncharacterized protein LOC120638356 [Ornithorhynchus anatinus]|uniref:uncharacterized protein LOC120638356 n=1 Tax=Ornithorhynchus anatinus TaxID=9258 RepID=UPI0019D458A2|nr:uncharacterized protein LOC120638356 [Ornithorhynchus anatinus]